MYRKCFADRWYVAVLLFIGVAACADDYFREEQVRVDEAFIHQNSSPIVNIPSFHRDIQPVLDQRCVVCHGCFDAPCQLKLSSAEGVLRGATSKKVYDGRRLTPVRPTRLFQDAQTTAEWRKAGFHSVLEAAKSRDAGGASGLMAGILDLKIANPLPEGKHLPDSFELGLKREQRCATPENFEAYKRDFPLWGMPYGLPNIPERDYSAIMRWLEAGAIVDTAPQPEPDLIAEVEAWEVFLNQEGLKQQLVSRYLYEHLYLANLYFEDKGRDTRYFKLVRSSTPPGKSIQVISTRRPYDDPKVERVYYRFRYDPSSIVDKTHMPYRLDAARKARWQQWFYHPEYTVDQAPGYLPEVASNPFIAFQAIPLESRYRFLLDEAHFTIQNFIKGSVCRGAIALNVIPDQFWVFFTRPGVFDDRETSEFLKTQDKHLRLPAEQTSDFFSIASWHAYSSAHKKYLKAKAVFIQQKDTSMSAEGMDLVWDGEGINPNASLTIFRHYDSATVVKGLVGQPPQTAWFVDYTILERIHYLLVAGFDVFGSVSHQAMTRMYMDFLRMESEMNFLTMLPQDTRTTELDHWYRDAHSDVTEHLTQYLSTVAYVEPLKYETSVPKIEFYQRLKAHLLPVLPGRYGLQASQLGQEFIDRLDELNQVVGIPASILPQTIFINVQGQGVLTLLSNNAYSNISSMFNEEQRRLPHEDTLTLLNGLVGAYPNVFLTIHPTDIPDLVDRIKTLQSEADYQQLLDRYGVRRTSKSFWQIGDLIQAKHFNAHPLEAGILDYNRLENR